MNKRFESNYGRRMSLFLAFLSGEESLDMDGAVCGQDGRSRAYMDVFTACPGNIQRFFAAPPRYQALARLFRTVIIATLLTLPMLGVANALAATESDAASAEQSAAASPRFDVWEYQVQGNSRLEAIDIERAVYAHLGPAKTIEDVELARSALEKVYRDKGFATVLVDIPEQDVIDGVVYLSVTEGQVERLKVTGSRYFSLGRIKSKVPALAKGEIPYLPAVQKQLAEVNRLSPDRTITPVLRPGKTPGKLEVELKVDDQLPLHGEIELSDRYTRDTERLRLNASIRYDNLWQREHSASFAYQVAPQDPDNVQVFSGTYVFKIPETLWTMAFYGVGTNSDVATVGTLGVVGSGRIFGVRATRSLAARGNLFQGITLGLDYKDFDESIALTGADSLNTPISYHKFSAEYSATFLGDNGSTRFGLGAHWALRGLTNDEGEFENKRFKARPNFMFLTASAEHLQSLAYGLELFARLRGQVTKEPLISNEQLSFGGYESVRGYLESQVFVDDGIDTTFEIRSPSFGENLWQEIEQLQLLAFFDAATGRIQDALPGQDNSFFIWSTGLGMKLRAFDGLNATFYWAYPLRDNGTIDAGNSRLHFSTAYQF